MREYIEAYVENLSARNKPENFKPTGMTKEFYLDVMEKAFLSYSEPYIYEMMPSEGKPVDDIQALARITSLLGILTANGRLSAKKRLYMEMMDICCNDLHTKRGDTRIDFSVKEIMLAFIATKEIYEKERVDKWRELLKKIDPYVNYTQVLGEYSNGPLHNINIYNMVGEYLREYEGLTDTDSFFAKHWPGQLKLFDENGMYKDPNCPILYDVTTRCQIQIMMAYGYKGEFARQIDDNLQKAGLYTLMMQSSAHELPYGGRSNQYLFNEMLIAANCEYEAVRYKKEGNLKLAGMFKRAGHLAARSIERWISAEPPRHIKNFYSIDSKFGTEPYGYYDKYMITTGCFVYIAFLSADDTIEEFPCPAETGGYVFKTGDCFHKVFANKSGYSLEIDYAPDNHYDSTGLGRVHKAGVNTELALSVPFVKTPSYHIPEENKRNLSLSPGWTNSRNEKEFLCDKTDLKYELKELQNDGKILEFLIFYSSPNFDGCSGVTEKYTLSEDGITLEVALLEPKQHEIFYYVPLFLSNGGEQSEIDAEAQCVRVKSGACEYRINTDGTAEETEGLYYNRNGSYKAIIISKKGSALKVKLSLKHD